MDKHTTFSSLATLRNLSSNLENQMKSKHRQMVEIRNEFLAIQRQYKDLQKIIELLDVNNK